MVDNIIQSSKDDGIYKFNNQIEIISLQDTTFHIIDKYACSNCAAKKLDLQLTQINTIRDGAFQDCRSLSEVIFPDTLKYIGRNTFGGTILKTIHIPINAIDIDNSAWNQIKTIESFSVDENNKKYSTEKGSLYNKNKTILYRATNNIKSYLDIPNFNNLQCVSGFALTYVPISSFIASKSLKQIESYTFHVVPQLKTIDLTYSQITEIPYYSIQAARGLQIFRCPLSLHSIKTYAFYITTLQTIVIFSGLNILENGSFNNCYELKKYYLLWCR